MKEYVITHTKNVDWNKIPLIEINEFYGEKAEEITATAQIAYNDETLLIRLTTCEKDYRKVETDALGMPCEDSCLEFFFCTLYFHLGLHATYILTL